MPMAVGGWPPYGPPAVQGNGDFRVRGDEGRGGGILQGRRRLRGGEGGEDDAATGTCRDARSIAGGRLPHRTESEGLATTLHPMTKLPEPVLQAAAAWERPETSGLWGIPNAIYDPEDGLFKLWYNSLGTYPARNQQREPSYSCYATSTDGINWERPNLGLFAHEDSTANNIVGVNGTASPNGGVLDSLEMVGLEPAERRFKTCGWVGRDDSGQGGHGVSFSPDGIHWERYEGNPVIRGFDRGDVITGAKLREATFPEDIPGLPSAKYALFPKVGVPLGRFRRRSFAMCTSEDDLGGNPFTQWTEPQLVLAPDLRDDEMAEERLAAAKSILLLDHPEDHRCEFYGVVVFRSGDTFLAMIWIYDASYEFTRFGSGNQYAIVDVQLAASRDLLHWERLGGRQPVIARGGPGCLRQPHDLLPLLPAGGGGRVVGVLRGVQ